MNSLFLFLIIFFNIYYIICFYKIFVKCGVKGYKILIPIYSTFIKFKLFNSVKKFYIYLLFLFFAIMSYLYVLLILYSFMKNGSIDINDINLILKSDNIVFASYIFLISLLICFYYNLNLYLFMAKSFNKSFIYGIGLIIPYLKTVLIANIAYSDANYIGNKYIEYKNTNKK